MQKNWIIFLLCSIALLTLTACSKKEEMKDDFLVFDFGTKGRMVLQGHLEGNAEKGFQDNDLGGVLVSNADGKHKMEVPRLGGSWSINQLNNEGIKKIKIEGTVEKEIFVASSYFDHSSEEQIILFVESIGSGDIDYTIAIDDILALKQESISSRWWTTPFAPSSLTTCHISPMEKK